MGFLFCCFHGFLSLYCKITCGDVAIFPVTLVQRIYLTSELSSECNLNFYDTYIQGNYFGVISVFIVVFVLDSFYIYYI